MCRPRSPVAALAAGLTAQLLIGCASSPEEAILGQFFAASRLHDRTSLTALATVSYQPNIQGIVTSFTIKSVTPERRSPVAAGRVVTSTAQSSETGAVDTTDSGIAALSLLDPRHPVDVATYDREMLAKEVTIEAVVRRPDGQMTERRLIVTMKRAVLSGEREMAGRWIVAGIKDAPAAKTP